MVSPELRSAYPSIPEALEFFEHPLQEAVWMFLRLLSDTPEQAIIQFARTFETCPPPPDSTYTDVPTQIHHPEFARYVAEKLGAV